jgi:phage terminase Nu1 subunit (DNA packaging protein)
MPDGNVIGLPVREPERYVTRSELAGLMGVSLRQVDAWRKDGMPCETWGLRVVRFQPSRAMAWVRQNAHKEAA